ncbi:MAG TPA: ROK family protein [Polyangia bacterium]|nr:ROK family protein [Polyangia bacterium]
MKILVIDIGGTHVKVQIAGQRTRHMLPSGPALTPRRMIRLVGELIAGWSFDAVSVGFPGRIAGERVIAEPVNLGQGWVGYDFATAFAHPVKLINDAAMQALGAYAGGHMLFLGLGTGLGTTLVVDGVVAPMELAHLPYKKGTFEDYVGLRGLRKHGKKKWRHLVKDVVQRLTLAVNADDLVLGGGNAKFLKQLPAGARLGTNADAVKGGRRLWVPDRTTRRTAEAIAPIGK